MRTSGIPVPQNDERRKVWNRQGHSKHRTMNFLLVGAAYSDNLGDGAICQTMRHILSQYGDVILYDIYGRSDYPQHSQINVSNVKKRYYKSRTELIIRKTALSLGVWPNLKSTERKLAEADRKLKEIAETNRTDAIVFAGGALFKGVFLNYINQVLINNTGKAPVFFHSCGIDAGMKPIEWRYLKQLLEDRSVKRISLRDGLPLFRRKITGIDAYDSMDPAVLANSVYPGASERNGIGLGIMLCHHIGFGTQVRFWKNLISLFRDSGLNWKLFTNGSFEDQAFAEYIVQASHMPPEVLVSRPQRPEELYFTISGFEHIISMRLHSIILSYASSTPAIAIAWDDKVRAFCQKTGREKYCLPFSTPADEIMETLRDMMGAEKETPVDPKIEKSIYDNINTFLKENG